MAFRHPSRRAGTALGALLLFTLAAQAAPLDVFREATVTPRLGAAVPALTPWRAESGQKLRLGDFLGRRPVILVPVYYDCPNICGIALGSLLDTLGPRGESKAEILAYSIDPAETPELAARSKALHEAGRHFDPAHVHFLTGDEGAIAALSDAVGYRFAWDPEIKQFAHASTLILLTPDGRVSAYLSGLGATPEALAAELDRAASGQTSPPPSTFLLLCYHYLSSIGQYSGLIRRGLQAAAGLTLLGILALVGRSLWREHQAGGPGA